MSRLLSLTCPTAWAAAPFNGKTLAYVVSCDTPQTTHRIPCLLFQVRPAPLQGFAYDQLKDICRGFEVDGTVKGKSPFPSFDTAMRLVDRGGLGVEWAWVRTHNIDQFVSS